MRAASIALICAALAAVPLAGQVPRPAPDFTVMLPGGKPLPLKSLHGKVVLLAFVFTTCSHCQHLTPELSALQSEFAGKGVQIVECAFNDGVNDQAAQEFATQFKAAFPVGYKDRASVLAFLRMSILSPLYVPHLVFIDRHGAIRNDVAGESDFMKDPVRNIRAELTKLTGPGAPAAARGKKK
jgi:thiol-disulfide isomerase/thioredoxin